MTVFAFDDPRWAELHGGYRIPYDPRNALRSLAEGRNVDAAWKELWNELHHQGDVGEASYAAVPELVRVHAERGIADGNTYALVAIIEDARQNPKNPELPSWLKDSYTDALNRLAVLGLHDFRAATDETLVVSIIAVLAMAKGQSLLGRLAIYFTDDERRELLAKAGWL
jgi:hypothetical protein